LTAEHILIVDDHPVVLDGLHSILQSIRPDALFSIADSAVSALEKINGDTVVDWLFLDLNLPDSNGLELIKSLRDQKVSTHIIILSSELNPETVDDALSLQVNGVLSKAYSKDVFEHCMITIELGRVFLSSEHAQELKYYRESQVLKRAQTKESLSERQLETLTLLSKGLSNKEIAQSLNITESTVKNHVSSLMQMFDATNRTHCVSEARRLKILG